MSAQESQPQPIDLDATRTKIRSPHRRERLAGIEAARRARSAAAPLVPLLAMLLTSTDYLPCDEREYAFSGHAVFCLEAMLAIESIGVPPDDATLTRLLADPQIISLPEACYDQGAYIGDYSIERQAPAGLAARLVPLMGQAAFGLLPELYAAARSEEDLIGQSARLAIQAMTTLIPAATSEARSRLARVADDMASLPEVTAPTTRRAFDLRDLAALCRKRLAVAS